MTPTRARSFNVFILSCGDHKVRGQQAALDIIYSGHRPIHGSLRPEQHPGYVFPIRGVEEDGDRLTVQGPNTQWEFKICKDTKEGSK